MKSFNLEESQLNVTRTYYDRDEKVPELIVCSAIKFSMTNFFDSNYDKYFILPMVRHYSPDGEEILNLIAIQNTAYEINELEQGFITNKGRFVDRKEALAIAKANNQIICDIGYEPKELYSEMLY